MSSEVILHSILIIAVVAVVSLLIKFLPFWAFPPGKSVPEAITYLGGLLPYAIMGMLVVYCLRNISFGAMVDFVPALLSVVVVAALHLWRKNMILSIVGGTACYMVMIQVVFV